MPVHSSTAARALRRVVVNSRCYAACAEYQEWGCNGETMQDKGMRSGSMHGEQHGPRSPI